MFSFSLGQGLVEHIFVISHGIMVGNYEKKRKKKEVTLDEKMGKVAKGKKEKEKEKERKKCSFMFLRFYVERAWNQKELSIGD